MKMPSFAENYHNAPEWQKDKFNEVCDLLEKHPTKKVTLEEKDLEHILWLAGWDDDTQNKVISLYTKILNA